VKRCRLRDLCRVNPGVPNWVALADDAEVPFLPMERVWTDRLDMSETRAKDEVASGYTRFAEDDILLPKITPTFEAGRAAIAHPLRGGIGAGTTELHVLRPGPEVHPRWLLHFLNNETFLRRGHADMYGVAGQKRISEEFVKNYPVGLPSLDEQWRVAEYLDAETARIDELIAEQLSLTKLLWERRRAAVFDAVTGRSVFGDRRRGVPWVDSIPAGWRISKLTGVARLGSGHTPARDRPELWAGCTIPWITTGEVSQIRSDVQEVLVETREKISPLGVAHSSATVHPAGTVVLCRTAASAGFSAIMGTDMATSQDFATWTCGPDIDPSFLLYCLRAMRADLLGRLAMGSTHRTIYMPEVKSIAVPLPSVREQRRLVAELRREFESLDETRNELAHQIDLLRERRQAIITAAVAQGVDSPPGAT
jgi:type I restriction enzyme S subunit